VDIKRAPPSKRKRYAAWGAAMLALLLISLGLSRLRPAAPTVEHGTLWFGVVERGEMIREVHAAGTLVPEHVRIIAAVTAGRVERLPARSGDTVGPGTTIVELSNPDVQLQALQSDQAVTAARSALANLRSSLVQQRLSQQAVIATLKTQYQSALRNLAAQEGLDRKGLAARSDVETARDAAAELRTRAAIEQERLDQMQQAAAEQMRLDEEQIGRLRAIVQESRNRVVAMRVLAGEAGVVQTLGNPPLELGQWVNSGVELARLARPGRLKALLNVAEGQAGEVAVGQRASIDTRTGIVAGHVTRAAPSSQAGTVTVEIALDGPLPAGVRSELSVDGTIQIERLLNALHVARPANGSENATVRLFKVEPNTGYANRVSVKFGRASVNTIEVRQGLAAGDSVVISDLSAWENVPRVRLK
jgi:multidrug resistance efflux pump